ncbi:MAG: hypothetical protein H0V81_07100 [Solirubrobacterales bacterium]|nr:hypothetical protein [Solirubrobacterales bacterium]
MVPALLAALGGGLLTAILNLAGLRVGATPAELVLWAAVGVLFARIFRIGGLVLAVPLLLAGIELAAGGGGMSGPAEAGDPLTLAFPGERRLALDELVFAAAYGAWAWTFGLRWRVTCGLLVVVLLASLLRDSALPALTLLAVALLLPNVDRLGGLLREE